MLYLVAQSCPALSDPMNCTPPGSSVHGVLQARIQEGLPCLPPGDLPNPEVEPRSPTLQADSLLAEPQGKLCTVKNLLNPVLDTDGMPSTSSAPK